MFGLTDQALQLLVGAILLSGTIAGIRSDTEDLMTTATAQYMATVQQATNTYVTNNLQTLSGLSQYAGTGVAPPAVVSITYGTTTTTTTVNNPLSPQISELIALGLLPSGFSATSPLRQTFQTALVPTNCPGTACNVQGIMRTSTSYKDGSGSVRSDMVADVVAHAGDDAGASYSDSPSTIYGFHRSWNIPNPVAGTPAILAMRVGSSSNAPCTIFTCYTRAGLYPLTAALQGGGQDVDNVRNVNATGSIAASGSLAVGGSITAQTETLAAGNSLAIGAGAIYYGDTANAAIRTPGGIYFQSLNGAAAANLNEVGNINSTGTITAPTMNFNTTAATCSWNTVTMRGANQMWVCNQYGNWVPISQLIGNVYTAQKYLGYTDGTGIGKPACTGGTATATIIPQTTGVNVAANPPWETTIYKLVDEGTWWYVQITLIDTNGAGYTGNALGLTAEVDAQCTFSNT